MLHGPPGTGKSTLAKFISNHCGYESRHINASDVRSSEQLLKCIKNGMTTDSHFDQLGSKNSSKPCCLIIDEVDGAVAGGLTSQSSDDGSSTKGFGHVVQTLNSCLQYSNTIKSSIKDQELEENDGENKFNSDSDNDSDANQIDSSKDQNQKNNLKKKNKGKNADLFALNRPIIFICNNLYVKPLRPLRELCLQIKIQEPDRQRLE